MELLGESIQGHKLMQGSKDSLGLWLLSKIIKMNIINIMQMTSIWFKTKKFKALKIDIYQ